MQIEQTIKRHLQHDLGELEYHFRSLQLFLEHVEVRFQKLLSQLDALSPVWQKQLAHSQTLEQELESTCQEVLFLQRELQILERILAQKDHHAPSQLHVQLTQLQEAYLALAQSSQQSEARILQLQKLADSLLEQAEQQAELDSELQHQNQILSDSLAGFEASEQEYLLLLENKEQELQKLRHLYEFELGQLSHELLDSASGHHSKQQQSQDLGKSLARLAQEKNAVLLQQQVFQERIQELEQDKRELQETLQQVLDEQAELKSLESLWQEHFGTFFPLKSMSYCHVWQSLRGLQLDFPDAFFQQLAQTLHIPETERQLLERRLLSHPGYLEQQLDQLSAAYRPYHLVSRAGFAKSVQVESYQTFLPIPAGQYLIGDDLHPAERPAHRVQLKAFALAPLPVSNAEYARFIEDDGYHNPDLWLPEAWGFIQSEGILTPAYWNKRNYSSGPDFPDYPVIGVSWYEAMAYATWAKCRLPSELEWETAGRGPEGLKWPWGNEWQDGLANTAEAGLNNIAPIGLFPSGASVFGIQDMIGNIFEWTSSLYLPYPYQADLEPEELRSKANRTLRGCSWNHRGHYFTRLSYRFQAEPTMRHSDIGFRVAAYHSS